MQKHIETKQFGGQLTTNCKTLECAEIERIKGDICGKLAHKPNMTYGATRNKDTVLQWRQTYRAEMHHDGNTGRIEIQFISQPTVRPSQRSLTINTAFSGTNFWQAQPHLYNQIKEAMRANGFTFEEERVPFKEMTKEERTKLCKELEGRLCNMADEFSEKWGGKALRPLRYPELTHEMRSLKREIRKIVDSTQLDRKELIAHMQKKADYLSSVFSDKLPLERRIDSLILAHPLELGFADDKTKEFAELVKFWIDPKFGGTKMLEDVKNYLCNYSITRSALEEDLEKANQLASYRYITRAWNK